MGLVRSEGDVLEALMARTKSQRVTTRSEGARMRKDVPSFFARVDVQRPRRLSFPVGSLSEEPHVLTEPLQILPHLGRKVKTSIDNHPYGRAIFGDVSKC